MKTHAKMKWNAIKRFILLYCLAQYCLFVFSLPDIVPLTVKNGLSNNTVYDVLHGQTGHLWFSTDVGISRYDGFRFRNFPLISPSDSFTQSSVAGGVSSLGEDDNGLLYLSLLQGGLVCFDENRECYLPVKFSVPFQPKEILSVYVAAAGPVYIATTGGLYVGRAERQEAEGSEVVYLNVSAKPVVAGKITGICGDGKEMVFVSAGQSKLWSYSPVTKEARLLKEYKHDRKISALHPAGSGLWICTARGDVEYCDLASGMFRSINDKEEVKCPFLTNLYISAIVAVSETTYYIATMNGLFQLVFDSKDVMKADYVMRRVEQENGEFHGLHGKLTDLCWDESQSILWISTYGGGAMKIDLSRRFYEKGGRNFSTDVVDVEQDLQGCVWIATRNGGIWKSTSKGFTAGSSFEPWTEGVDSRKTYVLYKDRNGRLWLGDESAGIVRIDPSSGEVVKYRLQPGGSGNFMAAIRQFCMDSRNRLWIVTTGGLLNFDIKTGECTPVVLQDRNVPIREVNSIAEDKEGNIWLGTNQGVKRMDFQGEVAKISGNYEKEAGLEIATVYSVYVNSYNQVFVSYSDKVLRIDGRDKDKPEKVFTIPTGLSCGHISCMVDDQSGNTWLGGNSGIMTVRNDRNLYYNFPLSGCYDRVCRMFDGTIVWANLGRLLAFDSLIAKESPKKNKLVLSELRVGNEATVAPQSEQEFVFDLDNNDLTFYFSDLQYGNTALRKMAYRLLPDEEWKFGLLEEGISYRHLPVGDYTLQVKTVYPDATEGEVTELSIVIKKHWWKSDWSYLAYVLVLLGALAGLYYYQEHRAKRRETQMTRELELNDALKMSKMKQEQKKEIEAMRNRLLTLFVQELRTPLSLIIAPLKEISQEDLAPGMLSKVQVAYRNSLGMLDACNQLLAIYTESPLDEKLEVAPCTVESIVDDVVFSVSELVRINQIDFQYDKKIRKDLEIYVDNKRIRFVLHNLLSNAFNHVRLSGAVSLSVSEIVREGKHYCTLTVMDKGKQIVRELRQCEVGDEDLLMDLSVIELGFDLMERVLRLHHGTIAMESDGNGTAVVVNLPTEKEVLEEDPNIVFTDPELLQAAAENAPPKTESLLPEVEVAIPEVTMSVFNNEADSAPRSRKTLLVVEDHKDIRLYLKIIFSKEYNVIMAINGQEGIDLAQKEKPDLILCDVMMPVKDGFQCCKEVKEGLETCHIPFIILTAKVEDDDVIYGLELGADDYITKPFTPNVLKAKVRNLINGRINLKQTYTKLLMLPGADVADMREDTDEKIEDPFISSVVKIVEENIKEADFNVKKLASEMNMSQPTLYRKIKQCTDFTIIELIRGVRMRKAAIYLKQKQYAVQEVAEMVGYNDIPTFRKHFVDAFGTTPSTYANAMEENS